MRCPGGGGRVSTKHNSEHSPHRHRCSPQAMHPCRTANFPSGERFCTRSGVFRFPGLWSPRRVLQQQIQLSQVIKRDISAGTRFHPCLHPQANANGQKGRKAIRDTHKMPSQTRIFRQGGFRCQDAAKRCPAFEGSGRAPVVRNGGGKIPGYASRARRRVSSPTEPSASAWVWNAFRSKASPARAARSSRICSHRRCPTLYAGAWPGQPR